MAEPIIIKSIQEASRQNPESSTTLEGNFNINISWLSLESGSFVAKNSNLQNIINKNGIVTHVNNNSNNTTSSTEEVKFLRKEVKYLKQAVKDKDEIIALLKKN
ncbi:hypothetical protein [Aureispira anguillae]|uniref:Uncharacterized protein n=1 Tax=Aureispira anguillae TaxID=2864201 RepID=A0A915YFR4_9BACT|nr:hypothetical protein [Aureispira anguillae]BDS12314.1 hypothetical protein AsAng_0030350 [Aureispira anguillae]